MSLSWESHLPDIVRHWFWPYSNVVEESSPVGPFGLSIFVSNCVGVLLTLGGALCTSLGSIWETYEASHGSGSGTEQAYSALLAPDAPLPSIRQSWLASVLDPMFLLGIFVWLFGAALHVFGLFFAPASLLGPVNSSGLVFTLWLSWALLKDQIDWEMMASSGGIVLGIAICLWASTTSTASQMDQLTREMVIVSSWSDPAYLCFCGCIFLAIGVASWGISENNKRRAEAERALFHLAPQFVVNPKTALGRQYLTSNAGREFFRRKDESEKRSETAGMLLALLGGICGSQTVCQIKEVEAFWTMTESKGYHILFSLQCTWALALLALAATVQFPLISSAYQLADHPTVSALYHVTWTVFSVIGGFVKFKEYKGMGEGAFKAFSLGLLITLLATYLAARKSVSGVVNVIGTRGGGAIFTSIGAGPSRHTYNTENIDLVTNPNEMAVELASTGRER